MTSVANMNDGGGRTTEAVRENWGWFLVLGIALVLCGGVAILLPLLSTYAASLVIGVAVAVGGVAHIIHAFRSKGWSGFFWDLLIGLIQIVGGVLIWLNPFAGAIAIVLVIAWVFLLQGITEVALAFKVRPNDGWVWLLLAGIIAMIAGALLLFRIPIAGLFVPGVFVGIAMVVHGWAFIAIALNARRLPALR